MQYFPFFLDIRKKPVLIVGGGSVAQRKAELLQKAGCRLHLVAPAIEGTLAALLRQWGSTVTKRTYQTKDIQDCLLVIAATADEAVNARVSADCRSRGVPINVVDCPALSDFIFPALIDRSPLIVAVSSAGASPVLARRIREKIEAMLPMTVGVLAQFCQRHREEVKKALPPRQRRLFWESILDSPVSENILNGKTADTRALQKRLRQFGKSNECNGEVYLIGGGPGAADLLTFRAHRLLQKADVVVHDRLVSDDVLSLARRDAEKIFVGKRRFAQMASQEDINQLLINLARKNLRVARLKGGDPFIFGRGGEELQALQAAGIPVQVVPGITAASGCAAALGMPLTHRQLARSVRLVTVYERDKQDDAFWRELANERDTTQVFYMAGATMAFVCTRMISAGRAAATPATLICGGSTAAQKHFCATLATLPEVAGQQWFSPALLVIGEIAALAAADDTTTARPIDTPFRDLEYGSAYAIQ